MISHAQGNEYRSPLGGLWLDREDALARLDRRVQAGAIPEHIKPGLMKWIEDGFLVLKSAVPESRIDLLPDDTDRMWRDGHSRIVAEYLSAEGRTAEFVRPELHSLPTRILDLYAHFETARNVILAPAIIESIGYILDAQPMAYQSLFFERGSGQPLHQDSVHSPLKTPLGFVTSWVALEDVSPGMGELFFIPGSHRTATYRFSNGDKCMTEHPDEEPEYIAWLEREATKHNLVKQSYLPRKGDVLLFNPDLAHGGSPPSDPERRRRSVVSEFCPVDVTPPWFAKRFRHSGRKPHGDGYYCYPYRLGLTRIGRALRKARGVVKRS